MKLPQNGKEKKFIVWNWFFKHRKLIRKADIVHCHDVFYWYLPFRILFPTKKIFTTFHGYEGDSVPTSRSRFMRKMAEALSKGNICVGDYLSKWYGTKTQEVTYGAVEAPKSVKEAEGGDHLSKEITFIGRLDPEAGVLRYLELLKELKKLSYLPHLNVLGEGVLKEQAKQYVKVHRLNVTFYGAVPDVRPFIERSDFVFTCRYLGTLEAFAQKRYVFCLYNNPIHRDCFLLSPFHSFMTISQDPLSSAQKVRAFIQNPSRHNREVAQAYIWVRQQTWDALTKKYLSLWGEDDK